MVERKPAPNPIGKASEKTYVCGCCGEDNVVVVGKKPPEKFIRREPDCCGGENPDDIADPDYHEATWYAEGHPALIDQEDTEDA